MNRKEIILLIGQKGSGKSFPGTISDKECGFKFIRVEDWAKKIKKFPFSLTLNFSSRWEALGRKA